MTSKNNYKNTQSAKFPANSNNIDFDKDKPIIMSALVENADTDVVRDEVAEMFALDKKKKKKKTTKKVRYYYLDCFIISHVFVLCKLLV